MAKNNPILLEIMDYVRTRKSWWLTPIIVFLILLTAFLFVMEASTISPFIYALF